MADAQNFWLEIHFEVIKSLNLPSSQYQPVKNAPKTDKSVGAWYLARATHIIQQKSRIDTCCILIKKIEF